MRHWQRTNFAPDRTDFVSLTSVKTLAFVQDATAHSFFFYVVVVTVYHTAFFFQFFFCILSLEFVADSVESIFAFVLVLVARFSDSVCFCIAEFVNCLTQFFVVFFVAIFTFNCRAYCFCQFHLSLAVYLDSFVSAFQGFKQILFAYFLHFAFYHHDVFVSSGYHQVHIGFFQLFESRVDNELTVYTCYTYF